MSLKAVVLCGASKVTAAYRADHSDHALSALVGDAKRLIKPHLERPKKLVLLLIVAMSRANPAFDDFDIEKLDVSPRGV